MRYIFLIASIALFQSCFKLNNQGQTGIKEKTVIYTPSEFVMGADLSYVNQILEHGFTYQDSGKTMDPYQIFHKYGANVIRFRLFHTPTWIKDL